MHRDLGDPPGDRGHPNHPERKDDPPSDAETEVSIVLGCQIVDIDEEKRTAVIAADDMIAAIKDEVVSFVGVRQSPLGPQICAELRTLLPILWLVEATMPDGAWWGSSEAPPWGTP